MLAQCRRLYEEGASNQALGAMFGIKPGTIAVMAWQRQWRRAARSAALCVGISRRDRGEVDADINPPIPPSREEIALNARLCRAIAAYWRDQGRGIALRVETMGNGLQCIRSRSINGVPLD